MVDPSSYKFTQPVKHYALRNPDYNSFLTGALDTVIDGSADGMGNNPTDVVFTFSVPEGKYPQDDIVTLNTFPANPIDYKFKYIWTLDEGKLWRIVENGNQIEGRCWYYILDTGTIIDLTNIEV